MTHGQSTNTERADKTQRTDVLSRARHQLAAATDEFQHALSRIKDPATRRQLTASYVDLLENNLGMAQITLTRYRGKLAPGATPNRPRRCPSPARRLPAIETNRAKRTCRDPHRPADTRARNS